MIALIDEYQKELLKVANFADKTVQNYVSCIVHFVEYSKKTLKIDPVNSTGHDIVRWMAELGKSGLSRSRLQHHRSALKTFFGLLCRLKVIKKNPAEALPPIRRKKSDRNKPVTKEVMFKLLASIDQSNWQDQRNYVMISMLWSLGLRVNELTTLRVKSFEPDHGNRIGLLRVRGKNKKQRALFVVDRLYDVLVEYLNHPKSPKKKNAWLFPLTDKKAVADYTILKRIKNYCQKAEIKERITPHVLRHSFATEMYHQGVPLSAIQAMLGHSNQAESAIYIHVSDELQKQALDQIIIEGRLSWECELSGSLSM